MANMAAPNANRLIVLKLGGINTSEISGAIFMNSSRFFYDSFRPFPLSSK
jgi:hypothetical protein